MRIAALYDIHGNLPALEAVLEEVREAAVDRIVVGGDVVPGPMPGAVLDALGRLPAPASFLYGNGERDVLATRDGHVVDRVPDRIRPVLRWVAESLTPAHAELMERWPATVRLDIAGLGDVLFSHATPHSDVAIITRRTPESRMRTILEGASADVVVCGHTHMPFDRQVGDVRVVNVGSVGMPFGDPGAYWALIGADIELRRATYDVESAARQIRATDYPQADEFADVNVLDPPSEARMLDLFDRAASPSEGAGRGEDRKC